MLHMVSLYSIWYLYMLNMVSLYMLNMVSLYILHMISLCSTWYLYTPYGISIYSTWYLYMRHMVSLLYDACRIPVLITTIHDIHIIYTPFYPSLPFEYIPVLHISSQLSPNTCDRCTCGRRQKRVCLRESPLVFLPGLADNRS